MIISKHTLTYLGDKMEKTTMIVAVLAALFIIGTLFVAAETPQTLEEAENTGSTASSGGGSCSADSACGGTCGGSCGVKSCGCSR